MNNKALVPVPTISTPEKRQSCVESLANAGDACLMYFPYEAKHRLADIEWQRIEWIRKKIQYKAKHTKENKHARRAGGKHGR